MVVGDLQIVGFGDLLGVPDPLRFHVGGVLVADVCRPTRPKVLKEPIPFRKSGPEDDSPEMRSHCRFGSAPSVDHVRTAALFRLFPLALKLFLQLREHRNKPGRFAGVVFGLRRVNQN